MNNIILALHALQKYRDANGMIVQKDGDGGDSLNRIGVLYSCLAFLKSPTDDMDSPLKFGFDSDMTLNSKGLPEGRYCRNPNQYRWYSNPDEVTRDQMIPLESAWSLMDTPQYMRKHAWLRLQRLMFHFSTQNGGKDNGPLTTKFPDICTPSELATIIRALKFPIFYPILFVLDFFLVLDVMLGRKINTRSLWDSDNQILPTLLASSRRFTTPWSWLACKLYKRSDAAARLTNYYSELKGNNGIEPLGEISVAAFNEL